MIADVGFCSRGMQYSTRARLVRHAGSSASGLSPSRVHRHAAQLEVHLLREQPRCPE